MSGTDVHPYAEDVTIGKNIQQDPLQGVPSVDVPVVNFYYRQVSVRFLHPSGNYYNIIINFIEKYF
jgi:hypothetical protein